MTTRRCGRCGTGALLAALLVAACSDGKPELRQATQQDIADLGASLDILYTVADNRAGAHCDPGFADGQCFRAELTLTVGPPIDFEGWSIYFSQRKPVQKVEGEEFRLEHINGDLHRLQPTEEFRGIEGGASKSVRFIAGAQHLAQTDMMPNYYVIAPGLNPVLIESTRPFIDEETGLEQLPYATAPNFEDRHFKRSAQDQTQPATPEYIFDENERWLAHAPLSGSSQIADSIIPTPSRQQRLLYQDPVNLQRGIRLHTVNLTRSSLAPALQRLRELGVSESAEGIPMKIRVLPGEYGTGAYFMRIADPVIRIRAGDVEGAANALRSLAFLLAPENLSVSAMEIDDAPRYTYRGLHLDVARNFHGKGFVLELIEQMAALKLNRLHLHLADDEGWRLEIPGLPELTAVGAYRCHDLREERCLLPQLGSGPFADVPVNGYYSREDYLEIVRAAAARHIEVIPSLDMPGHARAAVKAMEARYRRLVKVGERSGAEAYLLSDPEDRTEYRSIQHYNDNTINACMESSYAFARKVISEVQALHREAGQPLRRYHIGADETAGAWVDSPACKRFIATNTAGVDEAGQLGGYFVERVAAMLTEMGIEVAGWSDGLNHARAERMPDVVQAHAWTPLYNHGHREAHAMANRGWDVVLSLPEVTYFDMPYEADPQERGYYWASRHTDTRQVFGFMPDNLPAHAEIWTDLQNLPMTLRDQAPKPGEDKAGDAGPLLEGAGFAGIQGQLWSETVRSDAQAQYMLYPRLLALAERAWHKADWELPYDHKGRTYGPDTAYFSAERKLQRDRDWARFAAVVSHRVLPRLERAGIVYRLPTVGARVREGRLEFNTALPGLPVEYRVDGGEWQRYRGPVEAGEAVEVRARSHNGRRAGRAVTLGSGAE